MLVDKKVQVAESANNLAEALAELTIAAIRAKKDDGKIDSQEWIEIGGVMVSNFAKIVEGIGSLKEDSKNAYAFGMAFLVAGQQIHDELVKKDVVAVEE